jgi:hypothetical protein
MRCSRSRARRMGPRPGSRGTIITEAGAGTYRQPWAKSSAGYRTLFLPPFAVGILLRRQVENHANPYGAAFPTRRGTWRQISTWERM